MSTKPTTVQQTINAAQSALAALSSDARCDVVAHCPAETRLAIDGGAFVFALDGPALPEAANHNAAFVAEAAELVDALRGF